MAKEEERKNALAAGVVVLLYKHSMEYYIKKQGNQNMEYYIKAAEFMRIVKQKQPLKILKFNTKTKTKNEP